MTPLQHILLIIVAALAGGFFGWFFGWRYIWPLARAGFTLLFIWWLCRNPERAMRRLDRMGNLFYRNIRTFQGKPEREDLC